MAIVPTAGWLLVVELCNLAMYAFSRVILGAYRLAGARRALRGPGARAQPALRARRRAGRAGGAHRLALRGHRRPAAAARAGAARHALHARAVRAGLRDADRAGRADPRGVARRRATAAATWRWRSSSRTGCSTAGWSSRRGSWWARASARGGAHHVCVAVPTSRCRWCSRPSWASRGRRSARRCRSSWRSRCCCGRAGASGARSPSCPPRLAPNYSLGALLALLSRCAAASAWTCPR